MKKQSKKSTAEERKDCRLWKGCIGPAVTKTPLIKCGVGELIFSNPADYLLRFQQCMKEKEKCPIYKLEKTLKE